MRCRQCQALKGPGMTPGAFFRGEGKPSRISFWPLCAVLCGTGRNETVIAEQIVPASIACL
jgi:hypothetical protein